jgi:hypothetical protein
LLICFEVVLFCPTDVLFSFVVAILIWHLRCSRQCVAGPDILVDRRVNSGGIIEAATLAVLLAVVLFIAVLFKIESPLWQYYYPVRPRPT